MLSKVAAKMYFPFGLNLTKDTGGLSSSKKKIKLILIIEVILDLVPADVLLTSIGLVPNCVTQLRLCNFCALLLDIIILISRENINSRFQKFS